MEYRADPGKIHFLGLRLDHGGQSKDLIHGHPQRLGPLGIVAQVRGIGLIEQLLDDVIRRRTGINLIGVGRQISLKQIKASLCTA